MGIAKKPLPAKLIVSLLFSQPEIVELAQSKLITHFGPVDYTSAALPFDHTHYYDAELGTPIHRIFLAFKQLMEPDDLAQIKEKTNFIEQQLAADGKRRCNLDPGYLTAAKLVLATTKNHSHRIYIGRGIYAEVTLKYENGQFRAWPWTYPDYSTGEYATILDLVRQVYLKQLRELKQAN